MDVATVKTEDGMTIQSNSDTQAELEAAIAEPIDDVVAEPTIKATPDREPESGKFTSARKDKAKNPVARMEAATAKEAEAKRERDEIRADRDRLRAELDEARKPVAVQQAQPVVQLPTPTPADWQRYKAMPGAPKASDFPNDSEGYVLATSQFVADVRYGELRQAEQAQQVESQRETSSRTRAKSIYDKITDNGADTEIMGKLNPVLVNTPPLGALPRGAKATFGNFLVEQAYKADHPKEMLLHLSNEQEVQRLATLPPDEVVRALAIFDASLGSPAASRTGTAGKPSVSQAKPVFKPVTGSATTGSDDPPGEDASEAEYEAYYGPLRKKFRGR